MQKQSSPKRKTSRRLESTIIVAIIILIGTVITAIFASPLLVTWIQKTPSVTPTVTPISPTFQLTATPSATNQNIPISLLQLSAGDDITCPINSRVLPDSISPESDLSKATSQVSESFDEGWRKEWMWAPSPESDNWYFYLLVHVRSSPENKNRIKIDRTVKLSVLSAKVIDKTNIISVARCASGVSYLVFPTTSFHSDVDEYSLHQSVATFDYISLQPGEEGKIFLFPFRCTSPGIYSVTINISFSDDGEMGNVTAASPIAMVCPKAFLLWGYEGSFASLSYGGEYVWNGQKYEKP